MNGARILLPLMLIGITFFASVINAQSGLKSEGKYRLEGSWELEITPAPGSALPPSIKGLVTFSDGGGVVETILLPPVTPAHGEWEKTTSREFVFAVVHHLLDQSGNHVGTVRARSVVTMTSQNDFTATFDGTLFDPAGNAVAPISGTETGKRISVQLPK